MFFFMTIIGLTLITDVGVKEKTQTSFLNKLKNAGTLREDDYQTALEIKQAFSDRNLNVLHKSVTNDSLHSWIRALAVYAVGQIGDEEILSVLEEIHSKGVHYWENRFHGGYGALFFETVELSLFKIKMQGKPVRNQAEYMIDRIRKTGPGWFDSQEQVIADLGISVLPILLDCVMNDTLEAVRVFALYTLEKIADTLVVDTIYSLLIKPEESDIIKRGAIAVLSATKSHKASLRLIELLKEEKIKGKTNRYLLVKALGEIRDTSATPYLLKLSDTDDSKLRAILTTAFAKIKDFRSAAFLRANLADTNTRVVIASVLTLGKIGDKKVIAKLRNLLKDRRKLYINHRPQVPVFFDDTLAVRGVSTAAWLALNMMGIEAPRPEKLDYYTSDKMAPMYVPNTMDTFKTILEP